MTYILITRKYIFIIEGWTSDQFKNLNIIIRTFCWFIGLLFFFHNKYTIDTSFHQYFPTIDFKLKDTIGIILKKHGKDYFFLMKRKGKKN
jgi:hypothetical protein